MKLNFTNIIGGIVCIKGIAATSWQIVLIGAVMVFGRSVAEKVISAWANKS